MSKTVDIVVDGREIRATEGATLLQVMLDAGLDIPHYCYHPKLSIDGSCRLCSVKIAGVTKLQIACNTTIRDHMVVETRDPEVAATRRGVLELLLLNHPLDCPICDKAGECWLQNYSMRFGSGIARTHEPRRKHGKRLDVGDRMLLDQERCILCRRCVRFCKEISRTGELVIFNRGDRSILDIADRRLDNAYSMCTADVCPVGALETKDFHHQLRVWFLSRTGSICPGCSNGCNITIEEYQNQIWRLMPRRNDAVNDTWMCDAGRDTYRIVDSPERVRTPRLRMGTTLSEASWPEAIATVVKELRSIVDKYGKGAVAAVASPHLTVEEDFWFQRLLGALGVALVAMAVRRGLADDLLIKAEKAPNARGVRELGLVAGPDDGLESLLTGLGSGGIKGLYVCGTDLVDCVEPERLRELVRKLEFIVVQALTLREPLESPTVFLPSTSFAEKRGTFVNYAGRIQQVNRSIEPPPGWLSDGDIFAAIYKQVASEDSHFDVADTWRQVPVRYPIFPAVSFDQIGPLGIQLGSRIGG